MALLARVTTLLKANLNDLVERAEDPDKLLRQLLLDMENQYMQVKTQLAVTLAGHSGLEKRQREHLESAQDWLRKAELAVEKGEQQLARHAAGRSIECEQAAREFGQQIEVQARHAQILRDSLDRLERKMAQAKLKAELLAAEHRRAKLLARAATALEQTPEVAAKLDQLSRQVERLNGVGAGQLVAGELDADERVNTLDRDDRIERLLAELKTRRNLALGDGH